MTEPTAKRTKNRANARPETPVNSDSDSESADPIGSIGSTTHLSVPPPAVVTLPPGDGEWGLTIIELPEKTPHSFAISDEATVHGLYTESVDAGFGITDSDVIDSIFDDQNEETLFRDIAVTTRFAVKADHLCRFILSGGGSANGVRGLEVLPHSADQIIYCLEEEESEEEDEGDEGDEGEEGE